MKYTVAEIEIAKRLYQQGLSLVETSRRTGISTNNIKHHLRNGGVEMRPARKPHPVVTERRCRRCDTVKPLVEFHFSRRSKIDGRPIYGYCKPCATKSSLAAYNAASARASRLRCQYGLHGEDYANMVLAQHGVCFICQKPSTKALYVDHDHQTGKVRKLLCQKCNSTLGFINDDIEIAQRVVDYLRQHKEVTR
jgi:DNA-dependent RNA polymerase auxiliary subunit epsilon